MLSAASRRLLFPAGLRLGPTLQHGHRRGTKEVWSLAIAGWRIATAGKASRQSVQVSTAADDIVK